MSADLSAQLLSDDALIPPSFRALALELVPGARIVPLWRNDLGGVTMRLDPPSARSSLVLKVSPPRREIDLGDERARLDWSAAWHPVPRVLDAGEHPIETGGEAQWLLMSALPGESAVADRWRAEPRTAVRAIGEGLRRLHEALPVAVCPFVGPTLGDDASIDVLVVAHGDACAPNTLLDGEGRFLAHVDLGALGVADRWSDLAIASMSLGWNFGAGWEDEFFRAYGVAPDHDRIHAWRERWVGSESADRHAP